MNIQSSQVQLKISLSKQLSDLLESKAVRLGVPVTQFVKHLILKEVEDEGYPTFEASERVEKNTKKALEQYDQVVEVKDIHEFFKDLK